MCVCVRERERERERETIATQVRVVSAKLCMTANDHVTALSRRPNNTCHLFTIVVLHVKLAVKSAAVISTSVLLYVRRDRTNC